MNVSFRSPLDGGLFEGWIDNDLLNWGTNGAAFYLALSKIYKSRDSDEEEASIVIF